ncbi:ATP-dependent helicase HrpB [Myxococcus stipitatus]|uniref:ATP-dependent helicase HrpB n=1 Tax=Myxococcus stipitatus TaxID=83455 RepID=UPI001F30F79C|nr:ATP-dependent helicase HrpB [Myxococcus stipitatus]MCE9671718.1 ATP-dependent helicase HrpB [Myxococcus stipitatus]
MTNPLPALSAVPVSQSMQPSAEPLPQKQGASRFDGVLADKAVASARETPAVAPVEATAKAEGPVLHMVTQVARDLEQGQRVLDRIIASASSGASFSNAELLSLQASMYRYTQELDLVSRVVEKGTSGLKDVLKTQV